MQSQIFSRQLLLDLCVSYASCTLLEGAGAILDYKACILFFALLGRFINLN